MENKPQGHYSTPNPMEPRASNMYILQVKPTSSEGSIETDAIPLQMLINDQDPQNEQYFIQVLQGKQLQLFIDSHGYASTSITTTKNQDYGIPADPQVINAELEVLTNDNGAISGQRNLVEQTKDTEIDSDTVSSCNKSKNYDVNGSCEQKKKTVQRYVHIADRVVPSRAVAVLPAPLRLRRGAVAPRRPLPARVRFGPAEGIKRLLTTEEAESLKLEVSRSKVPVFLLKDENGTDIHIDVFDKDKSNWLSLLPLGDQHTANVWLYQEEQELYAATTKTIPARAPLLLGYSKEYVDVHKLPGEQPVLDLDAELTAKHHQWWCHECQRSMSSAALLQRHMDVYHSEEKPRARRYRCNHCARSFCRLFTLRRHVARHCTKKQKEEKHDELRTNAMIESSKPDELPDLSMNTTAAEDSRLPSDESLQTLTNNLDFSTNLFDTDRIPNLDISGSSRSEDFNPYSLGLKDDIGFAAGIDFGIDVPCSKQEVKTENTETVFLTCRYCNQAVIRGRQRQHVKACTGRKFQCECGRAFQYKDKLALHIHVDHNLADQRTQNTKEDELQYKCETCNHKFKRRGMLVNHQWRVHKTSTAVPLEKRVRHYPCVACPKVYRTAAKRDAHVKTHHPGSEALGSRVSISGGLVALAPAACAACPRQYATRAKLLQHVRHRHPALVTTASHHISGGLVALAPAACAACPRQYATRAKLLQHVRHRHPALVTTASHHISGGLVALAPAACAACPRQYATRAKLLQHVRHRHPALVTTASHHISGGLVALAPAACAACPRQYATRAKLLQHVRHRHPALVTTASHHISGGLVALAPAACAACPRQYATRAKLLQHVRHRHPALVTTASHHISGGLVALAPAACAACPRQYATRAKLLQHVRHRHPALVTTASHHISGGLVALAPAACAACPRQYATRAKLLQHVRHRHPALAPPVKKKSSTSLK